MIRQSAELSACGKYRYVLRIKWNDKYPPMLIVMLNPSKATHKVDDATKIRVWKRAARLGYGEVILANLGAGRATDPEKWKRMDDPVGPDNRDTLRDLLREIGLRNGIVVVGWGKHGRFKDLDAWFVKMARVRGANLYCLGVNKDETPKHPLYVASAKQLERFTWRPIA